MLDLTVVILTKNESIHIGRAIENVRPIARRIVIVDSMSTDNTAGIAAAAGAEVVEHEWPGNQAEQFNWALDNLDIDTAWILRLDADEYLTPELIDELNSRLPEIPAEVNGLVIKRRHIFLGKWMKRGTYPVKLLRIFRNGHGRCEQRLMDEHIQIFGGETLELDHDFCDHNLNNLSYFCHKHVDYAIREAAELLDIEFGLTGAAAADDDKQLSPQAIAKRKKKHKYARQPLFFRSFAYFCYRYFLKGAFLEGKEGFLWSFIQGWWYRTLVDAKVYEIKKQCGNDIEKIKAHLRENYNIEINNHADFHNNSHI